MTVDEKTQLLFQTYTVDRVLCGRPLSVKERTFLNAAGYFPTEAGMVWKRVTRHQESVQIINNDFTFLKPILAEITNEEPRAKRAYTRRAKVTEEPVTE